MAPNTLAYPSDHNNPDFFHKRVNPIAVERIPAHVGCGLCCKGVQQCTKHLHAVLPLRLLGARCRPLPCPFLQNSLKQMARPSTERIPWPISRCQNQYSAVRIRRSTGTGSHGILHRAKSADV